MDFDDLLPMISSVIILDSDGKRIAVKYYSEEWNTVAAQANYEKDLFSKTNRAGQRSDAEILTFNEVTVLYKLVGDLVIYVTGSSDENEVLLFTVLSALSESLNILLRGAVEKKSVLENLDLVLIAIDEIVDEGIILETEPQIVAARATMRGEGGPEVSLAEQTFSQAFANAKQQLARSLLS